MCIRFSYTCRRLKLYIYIYICMCAVQGSTRTTCHHPSHHEPSLKHLLNNTYPTYKKSIENSIHPATNLTTVFQGPVSRPLPPSKNKNQNSVHPATNLTTVVQGHFFRPPLPHKTKLVFVFVKLDPNKYDLSTLF